MFILTKEEYQQLKSNWSAKNQHTTKDHILYNVLRGKPPKLGFSPIKNLRKIESNGNDPMWNFKIHLRSLTYQKPIWLGTKWFLEPIAAYNFFGVTIDAVKHEKIKLSLANE